MSLTGAPLLVVCWLSMKLALGLAIIGWRRGGRVRVVTRTVSIVACQATFLFTIGVVGNRVFDLYPSWAALLHPVPKPKAVVDSGARLDAYLHSKDVRNSGHGVTFTWEPAGWTAMGLTQAPTVYVPQSYFNGPQLRFPVIVVAAPPRTGAAQGAWDDKKELETLSGTNNAIVVFLRVDSTGLAGPYGINGTIAYRLPYSINVDLRVETHGWAIIGVGTDAAVALSALAEHPERYQNAAVIADGTAPLPAAVLTQARRALTGQSLCLVSAVSPGALPQSDRLLQVPAAPQRLAAALRWVYPLLPPPLNPPLTGPVRIPPKYVPPRHGGGGHPGATPPPPNATGLPFVPTTTPKPGLSRKKP